MSSSVIIDKLKQYPLALACVVLLLLFAVVTFLRGGVTSELSAKEAELDARIRAIEVNVKNSKNLKQDTEKLNAMVDEIDSLLFRRDERAVNINFFYGLEDEAGVVISNISQLAQPDPIYAGGGTRGLKLHSTLVFNINLSGSYSDILRFLHEVHRADPLIRVADFQVVRGGDRKEADGVGARLRLLVLTKKE